MKPTTKSSTTDVVRQRELQWVKSNTANGANGLGRANERVSFTSVAIDGLPPLFGKAYNSTQAGVYVNFGWHRGIFKISSRSTVYSVLRAFFMEEL